MFNIPIFRFLCGYTIALGNYRQLVALDSYRQLVTEGNYQQLGAKGSPWQLVLMSGHQPFEVLGSYR